MYKPIARAPKVILYSGGMDSLMLAHQHPTALRLYINVGSRYAHKELRHLPQGVTVAPDMLNLAAFERPDAIIPGRNLMLVLCAAQFGDEIMLGATAGDASRDKDEMWASLATNVCAYMFSGKHFAAEPWDVRVQLPFRPYSKPELVAHYLRHSGNPRALLDSVSCYAPDVVHCGHCKSCIRKWVALEGNNIIQPADYWASDPRTSPVWHEEVVPKLRNGQGWRHPVEDAYTKAVLIANRIMEA